jgi:hypothetical protein
MRYDDLIDDHSTPYSTPLLECVAEAPPSEPVPASEICPWGEEYEANLRAADRFPYKIGGGAILAVMELKLGMRVDYGV